jgi:mRNA interferase RelE/StbE
MKKQENKSSKKEDNRAYKIIIKDKAIKQLSKIPKKFAIKIDELIQSLSFEPRPANCKKLQGYDNFYRVRFADYRVLYMIEDHALIVEVIQIGNRKDVYDKI